MIGCKGRDRWTKQTFAGAGVRRIGALEPIQESHALGSAHVGPRGAYAVRLLPMCQWMRATEIGDDRKDDEAGVT